MGSVIDSCECPICHSKNAYRETYYKIGQETIFCHRCGYNYDNFAKKKESGGFGAFLYYFYGSVAGVGGSFRNIKGIEHFKEWVIKNIHLIKSAEISIKAHNKWKKIDVVKEYLNSLNAEERKKIQAKILVNRI